MTLSALAVRVDKAEYSRYSDARIAVTITPTANAGGEVVTVSLNRTDRSVIGSATYGTVATKTVTLGAPGVAVTTVFDLLNDAFDTDGIFRAVQGAYAVSAVSGLIAGTSASFHISVVTVREWKERYGTGIPLTLPDTVGPLEQPKVITGVTITDSSDDHFQGVFTLRYTASSHTLTWEGATADAPGPAVVVDATLPSVHILLDDNSADWVRIAVDPALLPVSGVLAEGIVMSALRMTDEQIRGHLWDAYTEISQKIGVILEPRIVDTDEENNEFIDILCTAVNYRRPTGARMWAQLQIPKRPLLKLHYLYGYVGPQGRVLTVDPDSWGVTTEKSGYVELIPRGGAATSGWTLTGNLAPLYGAMQNISSFWHFRATCGLRTLEDNTDGAAVRRVIAYRGGIDILREAGIAYQGPLASVNTGRDGISESRSYAGSGRGAYAGKVDEWDKWLEANIPRLRMRLRGILGVVL